MPEDPNIVPKSAMLQSITAEANGFYGVVVTVASTFLGGSLLFLEKFAPAKSGWPIVVMALGWISLVASIGCIARVRFMNLKSGKLALRERYDDADRIDSHTDMLSNWSQWLLIGGMSALVVMGVLNFSEIAKNERIQSMNSSNGGSSTLEKSIPYGSLRPTTPQPASQPQPQQQQSVPANSRPIESK